MTTEPALLNYAEFDAISDERPKQLIEGIVVMTPAPSTRHQRILARLFLAVGPHVEAQDLGEALFAPIDVVLRAERPGIVLQPDLLFVSKAHAERLTEKNIQGAPDLVAEILSPSTKRLDKGYKKDAYAAFGAQELWFLTQKTDVVEVFRLGPDGRYGEPATLRAGDALTTPLLPGLAIPLDRLFRR